MQSDHSIVAFASRLRARLQSSSHWVELRDDHTFNELALELFRLQMECSEVYQTFVESAGIRVESVGHWAQIPSVPAAGFKEFAFSCLPLAERTHVFHSSQTTGQRPSQHFHNAASLALYEDSVWGWFAFRFLQGLAPTNVGSVISLTPPPAKAPHSSLVHMLRVVGDKVGGAGAIFTATTDASGTWQLNSQQVLEAIEEAEKSAKPALILGTAFSFVHLLEHMERGRIRCHLPPGSRVMETGGYKGRSRAIPKAELHSLIHRRLGIPIECLISEYGMSELSSQAYDAPATGSERGGGLERRVFHFPPWARAQLISTETGTCDPEGTLGLIRVLDLANAFSVMGVQTEDLGVRVHNGFELLGRASESEVRGCSLMVSA
jgi:hypothetical protein